MAAYRASPSPLLNLLGLLRGEVKGSGKGKEKREGMEKEKAKSNDRDEKTPAK